MYIEIKQIFNLIFFIFITNTIFLKAHDQFNGGCDNHCLESVTPFSSKKKQNNNVYQREDNNSCLRKSLCRGWWNLYFKL